MAREAAFTPQVQEVLPPDYGAKSQGQRYEANTGFADALKDFGKLAGSAVVAWDEKTQTDIRKEVEVGFDAVSNEFGVGSATYPEQDIEQPTTPAAVKDAERHLEGLKAQYEAGRSTERHYFARLNSMVRQLRGKYPGYREQIDNIVADVTGTRPANQLQQALFAEFEAAKQENSEFDKFVTKAGMEGDLPPDYVTRAQSGKPYSEAELKQYVFNRNYNRTERGDMKAAIELENANGTLTENTAISTLDKTFNSMVTEVTSNLKTATSQSYHSIRDSIVKMGEDAEIGNVDPEAQARTTAELNQLAMTVRERLIAEANDPAYAGAIKDKKKLDDIIEKAMAPIANLQAALGGEKPNMGIVSSTAAYLEAKEKATTRDMLVERPILQKIQTLRSIMGEQGVGQYLVLNQDLRDALDRSLVDDIALSAQLDPTANVLDAMVKLDAQGGSAASKQGVLKHWQGVVDLAAKGEIPPAVYQKNVRFMFDPKTLQLFNMDLPSREKANYLAIVAGPKITQDMLKLKAAGDKESYELYRTWTLEAFKAIFRDEVAELQRYHTDNQALDIQFDKTKNQFVTVPNPDARQRGPVGSFVASINSADTAMESLNTMIRSLVPIVEEEGMDTPDQIAGLLEEMGLDTSVEQTGTIGDQLWDAVQAAGQRNKAAAEERKKLTEQAGKNLRGEDRKMLWEKDPVQKKYRAPTERNQTNVRVLEEYNINEKEKRATKPE